MTTTTKQQLVPSPDRILCERTQPDKQSAGGLFIPVMAQSVKQNQIKVIAIGTNITSVKVGDTVLVSPHSGIDFEHSGTDYLVVRADEILVSIRK